MPSDEIERLQHDLTTMRQVMRLDKPYDAADIPAIVLLGLGGLIAIPLLLFTSWHQRLTLIVTLLPGAILCARRYMVAKDGRSERPELWKEYKLAIVVSVCVTPLAIGWMWWSQQHLGTSREAAGAAILFCIGVVLAGFGAWDSDHRSCLMGGLAMIAFAMAIPWLAPLQIAPVGAAVLATVMLSSAAMVWWKTRNDASRHRASGSAT